MTKLFFVVHMTRFNKSISLLVVIVLLAISGWSQTNKNMSGNRMLKENLSVEIQFETDWRFHRGGAQGAEVTDFDDSAWRVIDLPHDWSIEDLPGTLSPFEPHAVSQVSGGFT
ncbi:MAG: hypothetical protein ABFD10_11190, partial [Prolixibacteraceae bacterium]